MNRYIRLKDALKDFLKEYDLTINDILNLMDESKEGAIRALRKRTHLNLRQIKFLIESLSSKQLNLLLFVLQTFYISNQSGLYKGRLLVPKRDQVIINNKASIEGLRLIMRELNIRPQWVKVI